MEEKSRHFLYYIFQSDKKRYIMNNKSKLKRWLAAIIALISAEDSLGGAGTGEGNDWLRNKSGLWSSFRSPLCIRDERPCVSKNKKKWPLTVASSHIRSRVISVHSWYLTSLVNLSFYGIDDSTDSFCSAFWHIHQWWTLERVGLIWRRFGYDRKVSSWGFLRVHWTHLFVAI